MVFFHYQDKPHIHEDIYLRSCLIDFFEVLGAKLSVKMSTVLTTTGNRMKLDKVSLPGRYSSTERHLGDKTVTQGGAVYPGEGTSHCPSHPSLDKKKQAYLIGCWSTDMFLGLMGEMGTPGLKEEASETIPSWYIPFNLNKLLKTITLFMLAQIAKSLASTSREILQLNK